MGKRRSKTKRVNPGVARRAREAASRRAKSEYRTVAINAWYGKKDLDAEALSRIAREE